MRGLTPRGPSYDWRVDGWENERDRSQRTTFPGVGAPHRPLDALSNRGRVVHGYPATRGHEDALALLRREVDAGTAPTGRTLEALQEANAAALDALARVVGDSLDFCWLPGVEEGEARRMMGRAMVEQYADPGHYPEGPERRNLSESAFNEEGAFFAPFVTDEQRATFLAALTREAEKRALVMPSGADLDRYASEVAPPGNSEGPEPSRVDRLRAAFDEGERLAVERTEAEKETDRRINPVPWYRGQTGRKGAE